MIKGKRNNSKKAEKLRLQNPFGDFDKDGVINVNDCQPFNPDEHGVLGDIGKKYISPVYQRIREYHIKRPPIRTIERLEQRQAVWREKHVPSTARRITPTKEKVVKKDVTPPYKKVVPTIKRKIEKLKEKVIFPKKEVKVKIVPGQMGLLVGAKAITPIIRERITKPVIEKIERIKEPIIERIKRVGVYSPTLGYIKPTDEIIPRKPKEEREVSLKLREIITKPVEVRLKTMKELAKKVPVVKKVIQTYEQERVMRREAEDVQVIEEKLKKQGIISEGVFRSPNINKINKKYSSHIKDDKFQSTSANAVISKWKPYIKEETFIGTEEQFNKYKAEFNEAERIDKDRFDTYLSEYDTAVKTDEKTYEEYQKEIKEHETSKAEYERLYDESIMGKGAAITTKYLPPARPYAKVQTFEDYIKAIESTHKWAGAAPLTIKEKEELKEAWKESQETSKGLRKIFGLKPEPYEWERKAAEFKAGIKAGAYEEIREKPVELGVTVAAFAALPPVIKGVKYVWGIRTGKVVGLAAKVPKITKVAPRVAGAGLGAAYVGVTGLEVKTAPTLEEKGEVIGRAGIELAAMGTGYRVGAKLLGLKIPRIKVKIPHLKKIKKIKPKRPITEEELKTLDIFMERRVEPPPTKVEITKLPIRERLAIAEPIKEARIEPIEISKDVLGIKDIKKPKWMVEEIKEAKVFEKPIEEYYFPEKYVPLREVVPKAKVRKVSLIEEELAAPKTVEELLTGTKLKIKVAPKVEVKVKKAVEIVPKIKVKPKVRLQVEKWTAIYTMPITKLLTKLKTKTAVEMLTETKVKVAEKVKVEVKPKVKVEVKPKVKVEVKPKVKVKILTLLPPFLPPIKKKIKKKKIPIPKHVDIGAFKFGEITPVATPKQALGLLGVEVNKAKPNNAAEFIIGK